MQFATAARPASAATLSLDAGSSTARSRSARTGSTRSCISATSARRPGEGPDRHAELPALQHVRLRGPDGPVGDADEGGAGEEVPGRQDARQPSAGDDSAVEGTGERRQSRSGQTGARSTSAESFTSPHETTTDVRAVDVEDDDQRPGPGPSRTTGRELRDARAKVGAWRLAVSRAPGRRCSARPGRTREPETTLPRHAPCASATGGRRARHAASRASVGRPALSTDPQASATHPGSSATECRDLSHDLEELLEVTAHGTHRLNLLRSGSRRCSKDADISSASWVLRYAVRRRSCASRACPATPVCRPENAVLSAPRAKGPRWRRVWAISDGAREGIGGDLVDQAHVERLLRGVLAVEVPHLLGATTTDRLLEVPRAVAGVEAPDHADRPAETQRGARRRRGRTRREGRCRRPPQTR